MDPDIPFGMVFGRLGAAAHFQEFGKPNGHQAGVMEQIQAARWLGAGEDFDEFVPDALGGEIF